MEGFELFLQLQSPSRLALQPFFAEALHAAPELRASMALSASPKPFSTAPEIVCTKLVQKKGGRVDGDHLHRDRACDRALPRHAKLHVPSYYNSFATHN